MLARQGKAKGGACHEAECFPPATSFVALPRPFSWMADFHMNAKGRGGEEMSMLWMDEGCDQKEGVLKVMTW